MTRAPLVQPALASCSTTSSNTDGRDGEVVRRPLRGAELLADGLERCRIVVVAVHITQQSGELLERSRIDPAAVLLEAVACTRLELVQVPAGLGHADDGHVEVAALEHRLQRGKDLLVSKIARCAEEHERVGMGGSHESAHLLDFSKCPPNP